MWGWMIGGGQILVELRKSKVIGVVMGSGWRNLSED